MNVPNDWRAALDALTHPLVRALAWCIGSPSVFNPALPVWGGVFHDDAMGLEALQCAWPQLCALDADPAPLQRWMFGGSTAPPRPDRRPLGKTFELLIGYWLAHRADVAWVQPSVIVKQRGRVVGEFDQVWADRQGELHTLELTVKFYLRLWPERGARGYVGPMVYDLMAEKIARMANHQVPLAHTEAGQRALRALVVRKQGSVADQEPLPVRGHALSRGILFSPWGGVAAPEPPEVGPAHQCGHWILVENVPKVPTAQRAEWAVLDGIEWLGPQRLVRDRLQSLPQCAAMIGRERHVMVGRFRENTQRDAFDEIERWMVLRPDARVFSLLEP